MKVFSQTVLLFHLLLSLAPLKHSNVLTQKHWAPSSSSPNWTPYSANTNTGSTFDVRQHARFYDTTGNQLVDVTTGNQHNDVTTGNQHNAVTTASQHHDVTTGSEHNDVTTGNQHIDVTTGNQHIDVTNGSEHNDVTTGNQHIDVTTGNQHNDVTTGNQHNGVTTGIQHIDVATRNQHHDVTTGNQYDVTTGNQHIDFTTGNQHIDVTTGKQHIDVTTGIQHNDVITRNQHNDVTTGNQHIDVTTGNKHSNIDALTYSTTSDGDIEISTKYSITDSHGNEQQTPLTTERSQFSTTAQTTEDICSQYGTCHFVSTLKVQYCRCDDLCIMFNDCCLDNDLVNTSSEVITPQFECLPYSSANPYDGIFVINQCPDRNSSSETDFQCRDNDILRVGPWVVDDDGIIYQNRHCAKCNGKSYFIMFLVEIWNVSPRFLQNSMNYTSMVKIQTLLSYQTSRYTPQTKMVSPKGTTVRHCLIYQPPMDNTPTCQKYFSNPIILPTDTRTLAIFRNRFCVPSSKQILCLGPTEYLDHDDNYFQLFPLSVMFRFKQSDQSCATQVGGFCLEKDTYKHFPIRLYFMLVSSVLMAKRQTLQLLLAFVWSLTEDVTLVEFTVTNTKKFDNTSYSSDIKMLMSIDKEMDGNDMLNYEKNMKMYKWRNRISLAGGQIIEVYTINIDMNYTTIGTWMYYNGEDSKSDLIKTNTSIQKDKNHHTFCGMNAMKCELSDLSEISVLVINSIECLDPIFDKTSPEFVGNIRTIITYCGLGISILALLCSIVMYRITGMYESIPGGNVENLSISLLMSNVMFVVGIGNNDNHIICYVTGVALHYLWLSVFSFKSIALIHMCHNLGQLFINMALETRVKVSKRMPLTILGLVLPLVFVAPSLLLNYWDVSGFTLNYGGHVCFPTDYPANLVFVSAPIGLSVLVNISCFICIAGVITKRSLESCHIRKSSSFQHVSVFARISALTGIFWITGIVGTLYRTQIIEYIFIVCCSLQGFFIALANLTTKRVMRKIRKRF